MDLCNPRDNHSALIEILRALFVNLIFFILINLATAHVYRLVKVQANYFEHFWTLVKIRANMKINILLFSINRFLPFR